MHILPQMTSPCISILKGWHGALQGYVVLNRPYAFLQWVKGHVANLVEDYILMAEPDHIFLKPIPLW